MFPKVIEALIMDYKYEFEICEYKLHRELAKTWNEFIFWQLVDLNRGVIKTHFPNGDCPMWILIFASEGYSVFESSRYSEMLELGGSIEIRHGEYDLRGEDFINYYQLRHGLDHQLNDLYNLQLDLESDGQYMSAEFEIAETIHNCTPPYKLLHEVFNIMKSRKQSDVHMHTLGPFV